MIYKKHTIEILPDPDPMNPRENDNLGTMICFHRRYTLGDKHPYTIDNYKSCIKEDYGNNPLILPLYLYDHSGITISTSPFSCQWDSGSVGIVICSREKILKAFDSKRYTKKIAEKAIACIVSEVEEYDKYLRGEAYGYRISVNTTGSINNAETVDSCWGFTDEEYAISEAKSVIDHLCKKSLLERVSKLKSYIRNRVPLHKRVFSV